MKVSDLIQTKRTDPNLIVCRSSEEYQAARVLVEEYIQSLDVSLEFENIDNELEHLRDYYGPPSGLIALVREDEEFLGCICVRNLGNFTAEIKRMYVKPGQRSKGLGRKLLRKAMVEAKRIGYRFIRLDTIPKMESAIHLFQSEGFYEIEGYTYNPLLGARFMEYKL